MKANRVLFVALSLCWGCGAVSSAPEAPGRDADAAFERVKVAHDDLAHQLASVPAEDLASCKLNAGDCLLQVSEKRFNLVREFRLDPCDQMADAQSKGSCVAAQLDQRRHRHELTDYYKVENWCFAQLTTCTHTRAEDARLLAVDARFAKRKRQLEDSKEGRTARTPVEQTRAQVQYLRTTLPPNANGACAHQTDFDACQARVEDGQKALEEQLKIDRYDECAGAAAYKSLRETEAGCQAPELDCLSSAVASYGVFPESRKWVTRNLATLATREALGELVPKQARDACLGAAQQARQADIVAAYVAYAREPVLYFRTQLDKAFLALHEAQVGCLRAKSKARPSAEAVATAP
jgi:hypothetical protein